VCQPAPDYFCGAAFPPNPFIARKIGGNFRHAA
jgi:hypothetical protein